MSSPPASGNTNLSVRSQFIWDSHTYCQTSNIRRTFVGIKIVDHSDVVGASPIILDLTSGFNGLGKDNCKTRRESFKFWDLVWLILEILQ